jgi:hypothetical protein
MAKIPGFSKSANISIAYLLLEKGAYGALLVHNYLNHFQRVYYQEMLGKEHKVSCEAKVLEFRVTINPFCSISY